MSQLIIYARYIKDDDIKDEFFLQTTTKANDVLRIVTDFLRGIKLNGRNLDQYVRMVPQP